MITQYDRLFDEILNIINNKDNDQDVNRYLVMRRIESFVKSESNNNLDIDRIRYIIRQEISNINTRVRPPVEFSSGGGCGGSGCGR